jgi:hypothetical protein
LHSLDSDCYCPDTALTEWSFNWRKNGWRNAAGKPVINKELIDYILTLFETRHRSGQPVRIEYVKGHSGDVGNDGADALAVAGCDHPQMPERDWIGLKTAYSYDAEQDLMADLVDIDPAVSSVIESSFEVPHELYAGIHFERRGSHEGTRTGWVSVLMH